jgi:predicted small integral membrane protein
MSKGSRWFSGFLTGASIVLAWAGITAALSWRDDYNNLKSKTENQITE